MCFGSTSTSAPSSSEDKKKAKIYQKAMKRQAERDAKA
jgi:hypothetical protein